MSSRKSKSEVDKHAQAIREVQSSCSENKKCFECEQRGPTYVNMTIGAFVCTKCSGMLRGINPPHRIKSISMSSFTADEVEFMRNKGNVYCNKVWLGLYDKSHGFMVDLKDDEAVKDFIIQKYEKKRYYVDPSTIRHSLGSTASSISTHSQPSADAGTSFSASAKGSGMIGTTIQFHSKSRQGGQRGSTASPSFPLPTPPSVQAKPVSKPPAVIPTPSAASFSSNVASLAGLAVPAPSVDPFTPAGAQQIAAVTIAPSMDLFGYAAAFPTPPKPSQPKYPAANAQTAFEESFADFDAVVFDGKSLNADPKPHHQPNMSAQQQSANVLKPMNPSTVPTSGSVSAMTTSKPESNGPGQDRYAALKDLDEIFKTTVVMSETAPKPSGISGGTGASIFGTSPSATFASPTARSSTPPLSQGNSLFGSDGGVVSSNCGMSNNGFGTSTSSALPASTSPNWVASWPSSPLSNSATAASNGIKPNSQLPSSNAPINPFTGASNLTQLNTSPWPTTGTSPIQTSAPEWPPIDSGLSAGKENKSSKMNTVQTTAFPDPFGAAPSNLHQQSDSADLFANAPKPSLSSEKKPFDNATGFAKFDTFPANGNEGSSGSDFFKTAAVDPWATPPASNNEHNVFTPSMMPASNPNNPFL